MWIKLPGDDTGYACGDQRIDTRRCRPVVRARLERDVDGRAPRTRPRRCQRVHLGVRSSLPFVPPLADDLAVGHHDRTDDRIWVCRAAAVLGELDRALQEADVHRADPTVAPYAGSVRVPDVLAATWSVEPDWLDTLPQLVRECAEHWSLELEEPIDTPHSFVIPAGEVVLKLNAPSHQEADTEADALEAWNGDGAIRLLDRDDERRALLLERCLPGERLWDVAVDEVAVVSELLPKLQIRIEAPHPFALLADEADRWAVDVPRRYLEAGRPFERELLSAAVDVYRSVDRSASLLVNQDLHGGNVLRAERAPWLVIDPKPLVGERELEASGLLRNTTSVSHWLDALAELGFDRERARGWGVAHNLAWAWDERRGWLDEHVHEVRRIFSAL
jgi:streptomycin 6-kinase